ncbi:MAG: hypothetical protein ACLFR0_03780 [Alphaproteobacteria bacterium]
MSNKQEVVIINRKNRLKEKVVKDTANASMSAKGTLDKEAIKRAQKVIDDGQDSYKQELKDNLQNLVICWTNIKNLDKDDPEIISSKKDFHRLANHIADVAGTFGFDLMAYFGKSLRDFNDNLRVDDKNHLIIVQAHIDVMLVAFQQNLKSADTPEAKELIKTVSQAIQKYSD